MHPPGRQVEPTCEPQGYLLSKCGVGLPASPSTGGLQSGLGSELTGVDDDVLGQVPHVHEGLATNAALVWSDVVMVTDVVSQLAGLDKSTRPQTRGSRWLTGASV